MSGDEQLRRSLLVLDLDLYRRLNEAVNSVNAGMEEFAECRVPAEFVAILQRTQVALAEAIAAAAGVAALGELEVSLAGQADQMTEGM